jgi:hypothetical protein
MATIVALFKEAEEHIEKKESLTSLAARQLTTEKATHGTSTNHLFFHANFHPRGIPRHMIGQLHDRTLIKMKLFDDFIVAYHRPNNLQDL